MIIGIGYHQNDRTKQQWAEFAAAWVDNYTYYWKVADIKVLFEKRYMDLRFIETDYMGYRTAQPKYKSSNLLLSMIRSRLFCWFFRLLCLRRAGIVFAVRNSLW